MRYFIVILLSVFCLVKGVNAQVYNSPNSSGGNNSNTLYNSYNGSRGSSGVGKPLSIKNMLNQKQTNSPRSFRRSSNLPRPYGFGSNNGSVSMTSAQLRAKKEQDKKRAERYRASYEKSQQKNKKQQKNISPFNQNLNSYKNKFSDDIKTNDLVVTKTDNKERVIVTKKQKPSVYLKERGGLQIPQKVFNDIY